MYIEIENKQKLQIIDFSYVRVLEQFKKMTTNVRRRGWITFHQI